MKMYDCGVVIMIEKVIEKIIDSQNKAVISINRELIMLYWEIGNFILEIDTDRDIENTLDVISQELKKSFPEIQGFSQKNLRYMCKFAEEYKDEEFVRNFTSKISWSHNIILINKIEDLEIRIKYIRKVIENNWSKDKLLREIETEYGICEDICKDNEEEEFLNKEIENNVEHSNLKKEDTLHKVDELEDIKTLNIDLLKDTYLFDFLSFSKEDNERDLEKQIKNHVVDFLIESDLGFAFVGDKYHIKFEEEDYYIDLLFYHLKLRCYVAVKVKIGKFRPEYLGVLSFYLSIADYKLKVKEDNPTIGIILCYDNGKLIVQYAFRENLKDREGIEYKLSEDITGKFKGALPEVKDIGYGVKERLKG